jgi:cytochrome c7-like protein
MIERRKWTAIPGLILLAAGAVMISAYSGASSSQNRSPVQPIKFPHPVHVQKLGMNCLYCHYTANKSPDPGLPAVGTCMGCHSSIGPKRPASDLGPARTSEELTKLWAYADVKAQMMPMGPNAKPIPWIRIHKVPEYVHFPHMRHVNAGVTCQTCHGQIQKMSQVYQYASLNMGWCISCHVNGYSASEGLEAAGYAPPATPATTTGANPPAPANTERKKARYDCANCHY